MPSSPPPLPSPSLALPRVSREVRLAALPAGLPQAAHFEVVETSVPVPGPDEVLVRNRYFHVFPALRTLIGGGVEGAPFPPLRVGDPLFGAAVGEVVAVGAAAGAPGGGPHVGDMVHHYLGWRAYAAVPAAACRPLGDALPDPVAHLAQGWTAWHALTRVGDVRTGDTVFVTGGAGSLGSMAGQIARLLGAGRVVGGTGSPGKAERMTAELGYDAVVVRGAGPLSEQLAQAAPGGLDVVFDTVGGEELRAALGAARTGARFALVGALSGQLAPELDGTSAPVELDTFALIVKNITLRGTTTPDEPQGQSDWNERFIRSLRSGEITFPHTRVAGMEAAPRALEEVFRGRHFGTVVVEL
ncbi:MDR family NADP-dependent oxidoreductase [Streptomyces silvensis]|uniref:NADP-dependent oxidoreductase n=1 Tax=Streptomyces silvensis TaxID=1765722 RepID=A0A0W7WUR4_9ACTN|nr:NADP-dependent oxidoreductase [Streptomyces silvensis]KUF14341.1 NADP-dependent oxidoreductase [Streptomyces silvensis]